MPIRGIALALAWLLWRGMCVADRRALIEEQREQDEQEMQALLAHPPTRQRSAGEGFLTGLVLGALLGAWRRDDD